MKALIGMLLTVALATDYGGTANAQECVANKHITKHKTESSRLAVNGNRRKCVCKSTSKRTGRNLSEMKSRSYSGFRPGMDTLNNGNMNVPTESGSMNNQNNNFEDTAIHYPSNGYDSPGFHQSIGSPREGR